MITNDEIATATTDYLEQYPEDKNRLQPLLAAIETGEELATRTRIEAHVTASAFVVDSRHQVLLINHRALGRLLQPGGHIEPYDDSLIDAAAREASEETGVSSIELYNGDRTPLHIDIHQIPHSASKNEPAHWHYDFRYLFFHNGDGSIQLQEEEVTGAQWAPLNQLDSQAAQDRITSLLKLL